MTHNNTAPNYYGIPQNVMQQNNVPQEVTKKGNKKGGKK